MSIIRSNIARQLLAEGGAPRKRFAVGGRDNEDDVAEMEASMGISGGPSPSEYSGMDNEEQQAIDQARFDAGYRTPDFTNLGVSDNAADRGFFGRTIDALGSGLQDRRGQNIFNYLGRSTAPTLRGQLGFGKKGDINYVLDVLNNPDDRAYGLSNKEREIGEKLIDAGIVDEFDIRNMTQSKFDELFPGPQTGEGGDNEPIKKLKAPITEKKEEESKGEFDDILQFYGSRFADGGSLGNTTLQRVLPRKDGKRPGYFGPDAGEGGKESDFGKDTYSTSDVDFGGVSGGTDQQFQDARAAIMGPSTYTDDSGNTIDVSNFQKQGFTQSKIAEMLGPLAAQYGLQQQQPEVLGVLGGAGPSVTFGQEVPGGLLGAGQGTKGTTGTTGLGDLQRNADVIADTIFDTGSLGGIAADALKANREAIEEAARGLKDGGAIRQNYGLGSIVKKIGRTVKKVAKSPIGKAALFAGLGAYGLGAGPFSSGKFGAGFLKSDAFKKLLLKKGKDEFTFGNLSPLSLIGIPTAASFLMAKKDEEEEELPTVSNTDPEFQKYLAFYGGPRRFAQTGGDIDEAPMESMPRQEMASKPSSFAELNMLSLDLFGRPYDQLNDSEQEILMEYFSKSKDMPERTMAAGGGMMNPNDEMLNLGGNEMDLRGGGFVPLGEYEKKDDVPARLSKNEFVFTADAVRAAGGGSVDRGADLMYKTMKQLENKVV